MQATSIDSGLKALMKKKNGLQIAYLIRYFLLPQKQEGFARISYYLRYCFCFEKNESQVSSSGSVGGVGTDSALS